MADIASIILKIQASLVEAQAVPVLPPVSLNPLYNLVANTARNVGPYANLDPQFNSGQLSALNITDYSGMRADGKGRIFLFGGGHGPGQETDIRVFDTSTLTWSSLYPSTNVADMTLANLDIDKGMYIKARHPTARHTYNLSVIRNNTYVMLQTRGMPDALHIGAGMAGGTSPDNGTWGGRTAICNLDTHVWTFGKYGSELASGDVAPWYMASAACLDPVSKLILIAGMGTWSGAGSVYVYNPDDDTLGTLTSNVNVDGSPSLVYFPPNDKFYVLQSDGRVWELVFNRTNFAGSTLTPVAVTGTAPSAGSGMICGYDYDPVNKVICGNPSKGVFYAFDPLTSHWTGTLMNVEAGSKGIPNLSFHNYAYDALSGCHIFLHMPDWNDTVNKPSTWAFKFDKATAVPAPTPILPVGTTLQSLLDAGGTVSLGEGQQSLGGVVDKAGTVVTSVTRDTTITGGAEVLGKGILVVQADSTIDGLTLAYATVNDANGAGIRHDSGTLKVTNCAFVSNQNGYLGNANVSFDGCTFIDNGAGDGQTHAVYISNGPTLATVNNCNFQGTKIGHHLKSRSAKTVVSNSMFQPATESYSIDFPWGGNASVSNCNITQGPNTDNPVMINFASEGQPFTDNELAITDTNFASSGVTAIGIRIDPTLAAMPVTLTRCNFTGVAVPVQGGKVTYIDCTKEGQPYNG